VGPAPATLEKENIRFFCQGVNVGNNQSAMLTSRIVPRQVLHGRQIISSVTGMPPLDPAEVKARVTTSDLGRGRCPRDRKTA
jgi:hypothetical protein